MSTKRFVDKTRRTVNLKNEKIVSASLLQYYFHKYNVTSILFSNVALEGTKSKVIFKAKDLSEVFDFSKLNTSNGDTERHDTQHNSTKHNNSQHDATEHNAIQHDAAEHNAINTHDDAIQHIATEHNAIQNDATEHNAIQHDDTYHNYTRHNDTCHNRLNCSIQQGFKLLLLNVIMLCVIMAECCGANTVD